MNPFQGDHRLIAANRGNGMNVVQTCAEFNQRWNERLDQRSAESPGRDPALMDHAATCEACRNRDHVFAEFETLLIPVRSRLPMPTPEAIARWQTAANAGLASRRLRAARRQRVRIVARWGSTLAVAASMVLTARALLPVFWPVEVAPLVETQPATLSPLFQEAFTEASTMTWELAREITAPADRLSSQALGSTTKLPLPPFQPTQYNPGDAPGDIYPSGSTVSDSRQIDLISGSTRHDFRLLGGRDEQVEDAELVDGS